MLGVDFETVGLTPERGKLRVIQTANGRGPQVIDAWELDGQVDAVLQAISRHELVAHNASFEESWLREYGVELPEGMHDTMIAWQVLQQADAPISVERVKRSLAHVAAEVLGEPPLDKEQQTSDWEGPLTEAQTEKRCSLTHPDRNRHRIPLNYQGEFACG
jgi:ribonuclease D